MTLVAEPWGGLGGGEGEVLVCRGGGGGAGEEREAGGCTWEIRVTNLSAAWHVKHGPYATEAGEGGTGGGLGGSGSHFVSCVPPREK